MGKEGWLITSAAAGMVAGVMILVPAMMTRAPGPEAQKIPSPPPVRTIPLEKQAPLPQAQPPSPESQVATPGREYRGGVTETDKTLTEGDKPTDICAKTGGKRVDYGRRWRCVYNGTFHRRYQQ
jgi:hypothetical protein